ncbi:pleckstrin homology domain-containing family G member 5-like isoform X2 [Acanthaster planci]|nr:pleckstrin homology domain-containing family G member 5-like isoform X2 [Acanthaster planci]XP_022100651.1 pleckstrin homology domain-containing family G member 5-like isoform X2 [Acanthaster planci]
MDKVDTVHVSVVEGQQPSNDMDADLHDNMRSSFISNSSSTSGTSEDSNYRDSIISYSSIDSMDRNSPVTEGTGCGLGRVDSTRSMPPERLRTDSDGSEDGQTMKKDSGRKTLTRKSAIRRTHTLTPTSSPKVKDRRNRSISSTESPLAELQKRAAEKEFLTLIFDLRFYTQTHEVETVKDLTLRDAIKPILATADIDIRTIDIFIESSTSPTPLEFTVKPLGGRHLYVRAKAGRHSKALISPSFDQKTMEEGENGDVGEPFLGTIPMRKDMSKFLGVEQKELQPPPPRQSTQTLERKKDLTKLLGINQPDPIPNSNKGNRRTSVVSGQDPAKEKVDPKFLKLQQTLDDFMINGLPDFPALLTFTTKREDDEECFQLEESWRALGDEEEISQLTKKQTDQQEAIWEIIRTEVGYIKNIRIIVDFYLCTLINLQASVMLNEIETEKIFSNITAIEKLHTRFWKEKLSNVVKKARTEKRIPSALDLAEAFEGFADLFAPYIKFCTDEDDCMKYLRERTKDNEMLRFFVEWAQRHPNSRRLKLQDLLVYPMQRITKYPLLLIAVEKKTLEEGENAEVALRISEVKEFVTRVNHELRQEQERQKMEETIDRVEAYEGVSMPSGCDELSKLVEEHSSLDLLGSMPNAPPAQARWLHMKGSLKLRDADSRQDAYGFLFTDMFVLAKQRKSDNFRIIKPPMRVDMIRTQELKDGSGFALVHVDEYNCAVYACVLSTPKAQDWLQKMETARALYENLCSFELEYHNRTEAEDGSGEPPTSPEAVVFSMQNTAFPFVENSPSSSPLNSPRLTQRHLLLPSSNISRTGSQTSLAMAGGVSPVPEEEEEVGMDEVLKEVVQVSSAVRLDESVKVDSDDDAQNSINNNMRLTFPPSKHQSENEDKIRDAVAGMRNETDGNGPVRTQTYSNPKRPANLTLPPIINQGSSPVSPSMEIMSFESDDDEPQGQESLAYSMPPSPHRKVSLQQPSSIPPKKSPIKQRRETTPARQEGMKKLNGEESKSKSKLSKFSKLAKKKNSTPAKI